MYFSKNELKNLTEKDLNNLIINKVRESKTIDYKLQYNLESDDGKIKFLANFSAFANANSQENSHIIPYSPVLFCAYFCA